MTLSDVPGFWYFDGPLFLFDARVHTGVFTEGGKHFFFCRDDVVCYARKTLENYLL